MVRPPKIRPNLYDLLQQIESSDDDVSRRVAQAACDSDTSGSDHAVDDEDDSDSEVSMLCEFVDSTRSFPGLHAADDTCPSTLAGVCIRYTRVRTPVAVNGERRRTSGKNCSRKTTG